MLSYRKSCDRRHDKPVKVPSYKKKYNRARYIEFIAYNQFAKQTKKEFKRVRELLLQDHFQDQYITSL